MTGRLRSLRLGDCWRYRVTGTLGPAIGAPQALSGTIGVSVVPDGLSGKEGTLMIAFIQDLWTRTVDGAPVAIPAPAWMFAFLQDPDTQDVAIVADNMGKDGTLRIAAVPQVFYPGRWSRETQYANRLEFGAGNFVANTLRVVGEEWVETPAGSYLSWKSLITSDSPALGTIEGIDWWAPELGAPASFETLSGLPDGARIRMRAVLAGTSVVR